MPGPWETRPAKAQCDMRHGTGLYRSGERAAVTRARSNEAHIVVVMHLRQTSSLLDLLPLPPTVRLMYDRSSSLSGSSIVSTIRSFTLNKFSRHSP